MESFIKNNKKSIDNSKSLLYNVNILNLVRKITMLSIRKPIIIQPEYHTSNCGDALWFAFGVRV